MLGHIRIHIGLPRTGTTSLQSLFRTEYLEAYVGKGLPTIIKNGYVGREYYLLKQYLTGEIGNLPIINYEANFTISDEAILHPYGLEIDDLISRLSKIPCRVSILITIRNQNDWLKSWSDCELGSAGRAQGFFMTRKHLRQITNYDYLWGKFSHLQNLHKLYFLPLESFSVFPLEAVKEIHQFMGTNELRNFEIPSLNSSISRKFLASKKNVFANKLKTLPFIPFNKYCYLRNVAKSNSQFQMHCKFDLKKMGYILQ